MTASEAPIKWGVKTPDDLKVLRYIADATRTTADCAALERQKAIAGDQGHPTVLPPRSPISQMFLFADARDELKLTLDRLARAADGAYEAVLACDTPFVELPDNLSGEIVTPFFRWYQFDYYLERLELLHAAGKKVGTHLDGTLHGILPLLVETGLDFIESITPEPTGDVAIEDLREMAGPDVILFGGVPGAMFAPPFTADDMRRQVETAIEHHWEYGKFILGVADQVPPDGDMNLVRMVGELCEELCRS